MDFSIDDLVCVRFFGPLMRAKCVNVAQAQHVHQSVTVVYEQITQTFVRIIRNYCECIETSTGLYFRSNA